MGESTGDGSGHGEERRKYYSAHTCIVGYAPTWAGSLEMRGELGIRRGGRLGLVLLVEGPALLADLHHPRAGHDHLGPDQFATALAAPDGLSRSPLASHLLYLALSHI